MGKFNFIGKVIIAIGVLHLFRKVEGFYGYAGYVDNTWEILIFSLILITIGFSMVFISRKILKK